MKNVFFAVILSGFAYSSLAFTMPSVSFVEPKDGATVAKTFKVKMKVYGMNIAKAGEKIEDKTAGHHHLIIDGASVPPGQVVPTDPKHLHFGKGQTETEVTLPPGKHTLTLQFADGAHGSYGAPMSSTITVTVKP